MEVGAFTFSNKLFSFSPFAPTNNQLSLNPSEPMLLLPSSVISRLASSSNLSKRVDAFKLAALSFFPLYIGGPTWSLVRQTMRSTRWIRPGCCSRTWWEVSPLKKTKQTKVKLLDSQVSQICARRLRLTRPTLTAAIHVKVVGACDFSCFTC